MSDARSASELREIAAIFELHEARLDQGDAKLAEHDRAHAAHADKLVALENQIEIFRDGINQYCQRLLREVRSAIVEAKRANGSR